MLLNAATTSAPGTFFRERLGAQGRVAQDKFGVRGIQRQRATDDHFARQIAGLIQHVVDSGPMDGQQKSIRSLGSLPRCAGSRVTAGVPREPIQFLFAPRVTEYDLMARAREERAEFAAHQSGTENTNSHLAAFQSISDRSASCVPRRAEPLAR